MDVLTSETCWALNNEIIKQVTSSWSLFIQQISIVSRWNLINSFVPRSFNIHFSIHVTGRFILSRMFSLLFPVRGWFEPLSQHQIFRGIRNNPYPNSFLFLFSSPWMGNNVTSRTSIITLLWGTASSNKILKRKVKLSLFTPRKCMEDCKCI